MIPGVTVVALDLGPTAGPLFTGEFDGTSGFIEFGGATNGAPRNPSMDIGSGVTFSFYNVGGWDNTGANIGPEYLLNDHLYSGGGVPADNPVIFTLSASTRPIRFGLSLSRTSKRCQNLCRWFTGSCRYRRPFCRSFCRRCDGFN